MPFKPLGMVLGLGFLFQAGKILIGLYLGTSGVAAGFGAADSFVGLLV